MNLKKYLLQLYLSRHHRKIRDRIAQLEEQDSVFKRLMRKFEGTEIGIELNITQKTTRDEFGQLSVYDYPKIEPYIEKIAEGKQHVLSKEMTLYMVKSSGTTGKCKYIPMTASSLQNQVDGPKRMLAHIVKGLQLPDIFKAKALIFSDAFRSTRMGKYAAESLSSHLSIKTLFFLSRFIVPQKSTQKHPDLQLKIQLMAEECTREKVSFAVAMPAWFNTLLNEMTGEVAKESFSELELISFSGMDPHPYIKSIAEKIGTDFRWIQSYPSSEGFFAYSDELRSDSMLLITDHLIYYEFLPFEHIAEKSRKLALAEVETGKVYLMIITSANGLISYTTGDLVEFSTIDPFRIKIRGRIGDNISVSGELVSEHHINNALCKALSMEISEIHNLRFVVFPQHDETGKPSYCWIIENQDSKYDEVSLAEKIDVFLQNESQNYEDNRKGNILLKPTVILVAAGTIDKLFLDQSNLGLQSKIRKIYAYKPDFIRLMK